LGSTNVARPSRVELEEMGAPDVTSAGDDDEQKGAATERHENLLNAVG
jgi:hypothetical protein